LNEVDLFLLILFLVSAVRGYVRGIFREIMGLAGFLVGGAAAAAFCRPAASVVHRYADLGPRSEQVLAAILIFLVVNLLTHLVAIGFDRLARAMFLSGVTRAVGAVVGVAKAAVVLGFLLFVVRSYVPVPRVVEAIDSSALGAPLAGAAAIVVRAGAGALGSPGPGRGLEPIP